MVFALRAVAKEYTANRRAQRAYDAILTEVLREDLEGVRYDPNVPIEDREEKAVAPEYISMVCPLANAAHRGSAISFLSMSPLFPSIAHYQDPSRSLLPDILKKGERAGLVYQYAPAGTDAGKRAYMIVGKGGFMRGGTHSWVLLPTHWCELDIWPFYGV